MSRRKLSLFLFIDAFGWEQRQRNPDFLADITTDAKPLETILGYSSACDPSILSGLTPAEHGLWSSYFYDPEGSPFQWTRPLAHLPESILSRGRVRGRLSPWVKKKCGFTGYFQLYAVPFKHLPLFNYAEQKRIWEPGGLPRGESIFDRMAQEGLAAHAHDSAYPDEVRLEQLKEKIAAASVDFAYCSLGKLDALMHAKGTQTGDIATLMRWYDEQLRSIITLAESSYDEVSWYVFTDHGMHEVTDSHDLIADVEKLGLAWNRDYVAFYDSTMARFWFKNSAARDTIHEMLSSHDRGRVVSEAELQRHGVFFEDAQYGELIFLMNSGIQIAPSFMGVKPCRGMHGFDPADASSKAAIASNKPIPTDITKIQHIHQLMLKELDLD